MSLRAKLILSFLLLSVIPLSAVVAFHYWSSSEALRLAAMAEMLEMADSLTRRMDRVATYLDREVKRLGELPFAALVAGAEGSLGEEEMSEVQRAFGSISPWVDSLEFVPGGPPEVEGTPAVRAEQPVGPSPGSLAPAPPSETPAAPLVIDVGELVARMGGELDAAQLDWAGFVEDEADLEALAARAEAWGAEVAGRALEYADEMQTRVELHLQEAEQIERDQEDRRLSIVRRLDEEEVQRLAGQRSASKRLLGAEYDCAVEKEGEEIGRLRANIQAKRLLQSVLAQARREQGEIPFALDDEGTLYTVGAEDRKVLEGLDVGAVADASGEARERRRDWVIVKTSYPESRLSFGMARPIADSLKELQRTSGRNLGYGLGVVGLALVGVVPLSRRITRNLTELTHGSEQLASGDLEVEVPVRSRDEVGQLAEAFNRMARELRENQRKLLEGAVRQRMLAAENERKGAELEEARRFQLSLLPKAVPEHPDFEIATFMRTATEVGGDYYDFRVAGDGALTVAIGDATGHGAKAGTMVTVVKSLFTADAGRPDLSSFLEEAAAAVKRMELGRMAMALSLVRIRDRRLTVSAAGMPPVLILRAATGRVEEIALQGLPLGGMARSRYEQRSVGLEPGDVVLLMSDGFPELANREGDPLGYGKVRELFEAAAGKSPEELISRLSAEAEAWTGGEPPADDVTFVALRVRGSSSA